MDTRRGFFSRLLGIGAAAAVAKVVPAAPNATAGLLTGPPSDMLLYDEARSLYITDVTSEYTNGFAIVTPSGESIDIVSRGGLFSVRCDNPTTEGVESVQKWIDECERITLAHDGRERFIALPPSPYEITPPPGLTMAPWWA